MKLIPLYGKYNIGKFVKVDDEDFERLSKYKWNTGRPEYGGNKYASRMPWVKGIGTTKRIKMHRDIMGVTDPSIIVDHIDRDTFNNQKSNLRIVSASLNAVNTGIKGKNKKFKGIYKRVYNTRTGIKSFWFAKVCKDQKTHQSRPCETEQEAALAYNYMVNELYKQVVYNNKVEGVFEIYKPKKTKAKKILQCTLDGILITEWNSATEAAKVLNLSQGCISAACRGKYKQCSGYLWKNK